ncbi:hypothetical protein Esi_0010_0047 [Ectocarpus siliculosus]|uniref:Uncharacterized protein n=1 Tax=Ectocarpus siliculosus TaxID=2880 RepID=D8LBX6_ECTSI|nr:hypothetical protein Esi_0010_0047 [Ectocarpus siliculosus]|eukprot:CBN79159.1 hypothetical protein Esi_0010_0047 [Ectocarpus siliculosus]
MDSWAHQGRRASQRRSSHVESDVSGSGSRGDGYEWERVAQATLEHAFGHEFTAKYQMYTEEAASIMRRLSRIFVNLMKRYVLGEIVLQDMSIQLSAAVWRDLTSSFFQWEGASVVRELLPARGVEFRFDVSLTASEMGCASGSRTALEIVTALTKRTMLQLGRVVLSEARRALFNRESVVEILVNSIIHKDGGSAAAAVATAAAAAARVEKGQDGVGAPGEGGGEGGLRRVGDGEGRRSGVTLVGVLAKGVATIAERKRVAEVLTVLKHALFKAITINAGGDDPDEGNKGLAALLANTEVDRGSGLARKTSLTSSSSASNLAGISNSTGEGGCEETGKVGSSGVLVSTTATISTGNADPNSSGGGRRPRRRWSGSGAGVGGSGGGFGSGGGGGQSIRRKGSRGVS